MLILDKYTRVNAPKYRTIYLTQESVPGRTFTRYKVTPEQDGQQVLVDAISRDHAKHFYEMEFWAEADYIKEV